MRRFFEKECANFQPNFLPNVKRKTGSLTALDDSEDKNKKYGTNKSDREMAGINCLSIYLKISKFIFPMFSI